MNSADENVFIAAISSDIGHQMALKYRKRGSSVIGTYRNTGNLDLLRSRDGISLLSCDVSKVESIRATASQVASLDKPWDIFVSAVGQLTPIGPFFDTDIDEWADSVAINSINQLRLLHSIYPYRRKSGICKVVFLVGGGINNAFTNYSAYCAAKIFLIKMCELLDDEYTNVHAIAIGTGWVNTKIHHQTLNAGVRTGINFRRTYEFVSSGKQGTSYDDIFDCINWCFGQDRALTGGRNFSVVHDAWKRDDGRLLFDLSQDANKFKLRRSGG